MLDVITIHNLKLHYRALGKQEHGTNKTTHRPMQQMGDPDTIHGATATSFCFLSVFLQRCQKNTQDKKDSLFNKWPLVKLDVYMKKSETKYLFSPHTKFNPNYIKDLNVRPVTLNCLRRK